MAGQLKIGGNVIATHAGAEGAGTVTLDSSTLTIGSNTTISGSTIDSSTTFPAGNVINLEIKNIPSSAHTLNTTDSYLTGITFSYAVKEQTSKLYIACYPLFQTEHDGANYSYKLSLRSDVDSYASTIGGGNVPNVAHYGSTSQVQHLQYPTIVSCFHDHNQNTGTTITYRMFAKVNAGTKGIYMWDSWGHTAGPTTSQHAVIYEVAQ